MSVNIMLGPGPSSVATRVIGTGLLENFGCEACRETEGRSERVEGGRFDLSFEGVLSGPFKLESLLWLPSDSTIIEVARFETESGFLFCSGLVSRVFSSSGVEAADCPLVKTVVIDSERRDLRVGACGTRTSLSPVDFLDGGGPLIVSPWLRLRLIFEIAGDSGSLADSKSSISASLAALLRPSL